MAHFNQFMKNAITSYRALYLDIAIAGGPRIKGFEIQAILILSSRFVVCLKLGEAFQIYTIRKMKKHEIISYSAPCWCNLKGNTPVFEGIRLNPMGFYLMVLL